MKVTKRILTCCETQRPQAEYSATNGSTFTKEQNLLRILKAGLSEEKLSIKLTLPVQIFRQQKKLAASNLPFQMFERFIET